MIGIGNRWTPDALMNCRTQQGLFAQRFDHPVFFKNWCTERETHTHTHVETILTLYDGSMTLINMICYRIAPPP